MSIYCNTLGANINTAKYNIITALTYTPTPTHLGCVDLQFGRECTCQATFTRLVSCRDSQAVKVKTKAPVWQYLALVVNGDGEIKNMDKVICCLYAKEQVWQLDMYLETLAGADRFGDPLRTRCQPDKYGLLE